MLIKTLDGEDNEALRECRKLNHELHSNIMHQNIFWKHIEYYHEIPSPTND